MRWSWLSDLYDGSEGACIGGQQTRRSVESSLHVFTILSCGTSWRSLPLSSRFGTRHGRHRHTHTAYSWFCASAATSSFSRDTGLACLLAGWLTGWLAGFAPRQSPYASEQATFLNLHGHDETDSVVVDCPRVAACCLSLLSPHPE